MSLQVADNKAPGYRTNPTHRVDIGAATGRLRIAFKGTVLADSAHALVVDETKYERVYYLPRADVRMEHLRRTAHGSHCPYKGDASSWTVVVGGEEAENAAWSYETPFDEAAPLRGLVAFWIKRLPGAVVSVNEEKGSDPFNLVESVTY